MEKRIVTTLLALLSLTSLWAQKGTIRGTVYDKESGETLIGAAVKVLEVPNTVGATDLDGAAGDMKVYVAYAVDFDL